MELSEWMGLKPGDRIKCADDYKTPELRGKPGTVTQSFEAKLFPFIEVRFDNGFQCVFSYRTSLERLEEKVMPKHHLGIYPVLWSVHNSEGAALEDWKKWVYPQSKVLSPFTHEGDVWFRTVLPTFEERNEFVHSLFLRGIIRACICEKQLDQAEEVWQ